MCISYYANFKPPHQSFRHRKQSSPEPTTLTNTSHARTLARARTPNRSMPLRSWAIRSRMGEGMPSPPSASTSLSPTTSCPQVQPAHIRFTTAHHSLSVCLSSPYPYTHVSTRSLSPRTSTHRHIILPLRCPKRQRRHQCRWIHRCHHCQQQTERVQPRNRCHEQRQNTHTW